MMIPLGRQLPRALEQLPASISLETQITDGDEWFNILVMAGDKHTAIIRLRRLDGGRPGPACALCDRRRRRRQAKPLPFLFAFTAPTASKAVPFVGVCLLQLFCL